MMDLMHIQSQAAQPNLDEVRRRLAPMSENIRDGICDVERAAIQEAAEAFESYFLQIMLREMRRTLPEDGGIIPTSQGERIFTEMLDEEKAQEMARAGGIGLAQTIVQQMTRQSYAANMR